MTMVAITNLTAYLPDWKVSNQDLAKKYEKDFEARYPGQNPVDVIKKICGIETRHYASENEMTSHLAEKVVAKLFAEGVNPMEIDAIIVATATPDRFYPSVAATVMSRLNLKNMEGFDISAACCGFVYAIEDAAARISSNFGFHSKRWNKIIVVSADCVSRTLNPINYQTGILFGDAAMACVVERTDDETSSGSRFGIRNAYSKVVANHLDDVFYTSPFGLQSNQKWEDVEFELDGGAVYRHGIGFTKDFVAEYCNKFNVNLDEYSYFIPHQSNQRMLETLRKDLGLGERLLSNVSRVGNTVASSTPLCLLEYADKGHFKKGDTVILCAFGAGYTLGILDLEVL